MKATIAIRTPKELKKAITTLVEGNRDYISPIATYIAYNYYMDMHIEAGSPEDLENEEIYTAFAKEHPDLHQQVENGVDFIYKKDD